MNYRLTTGAALCLLGVLASFALTFWFGPRHGSLVDQRLTGVRKNITALLDELKVLQSTAPKGDLDALAETISRTQPRSTRLEGQIGSIQTTLKGIPQSISGGLFRSGFSWNKDATLAAITALQTSIADMNRDILEASTSVKPVSLALVDLSQRVSDIDARVVAEFRKMDEELAALSEPEKLLSTLWMPLLLALVTTIAGLSLIGLGWRKDRRDLEELRLKNNGLATVTPISAPAPAITAEQKPTG